MVDHAGKLVANISVSDLQYVVERNLDNLFMTVEHFLQRVPRRPLITCPPTATLVLLPPRPPLPRLAPWNQPRVSCRVVRWGVCGGACCVSYRWK